MTADACAMNRSADVEAAAQRGTLQSVFATAMDDDAVRADVQRRLAAIEDPAALAKITLAVTEIYTSTVDGDADERNAKLQSLCPLIAGAACVAYLLCPRDTFLLGTRFSSWERRGHAELAQNDEEVRRALAAAERSAGAAESDVPSVRLDAQALERINTMGTPRGSHSGASPQRVSPHLARL